MHLRAPATVIPLSALSILAVVAGVLTTRLPETDAGRLYARTRALVQALEKLEFPRAEGLLAPEYRTRATLVALARRVNVRRGLPWLVQAVDPSSGASLLAWKAGSGGTSRVTLTWRRGPGGWYLEDWREG